MYVDKQLQIYTERVGEGNYVGKRSLLFSTFVDYLLPCISGLPDLEKVVVIPYVTSASSNISTVKNR